jgi:hypothetical protein
VGTRRERVILDAEDRYSATFVKAAAATAFLKREVAELNRELNQLDRQSISVGVHTRQMADRDLPAVRRQADQTGNSIDKLSGRLGLMAKGIGALGPTISPLSTAAVAGLAGIASEAGFAAIALGVLVGSFNGVGDALGAVNKYALDPSDEHLKAMNIAMGELAPSAQAAVMAMRELGPALKGIRDSGMENFFPGFVSGLDQFGAIAPKIEPIFASIAKSAGALFAAGGADLASGEWDGFFQFIENEAGPALTILGHTVGNVTKGLAELWMAMDPLNDDVANGLLKASQGFEGWAEGLSKTEGFQEFIAYVRETGPQVMETIGSIADALLQIGQAAAPLGGPVLQAIEGIAKAIAAIADSPLGTPIMGMVTALSAASLAMSAFNKVAAISFGRGGSRTTLGAGVKGFTRDVSMMSEQVLLSGTSLKTTTAAMQRNAAATERMKATMGKAALGAAALGAAYGASAAGINLNNTMMGASIGLMAGPWGAAIGGGAGMLLDLRDAANSADGAIQSMNEAIATGSSADIGRALDALAAQSEDFKEKTSKLESAVKLIPIAGAYLGTKVGGDRDEGRARIEAARKRGEEAERKAAAAELAASQVAFTNPGRVNELVKAFHDLGEEGKKTVSTVDRLKAAIDSLLGPKMNLSAATDAWTQSLHDLNDDLSENSRTLVGNSDAALQNRGAIRSRVTALTDMLKAQADAGKGADVLATTLRNGIKSLVDTGVAAGMSEKQIHDYARQLGLTPKIVRTLINAETKKANDNIRAFRNNLDSIKDKTVRLSVVRQVLTGTGLGGQGQGAGVFTNETKDALGRAGGGTIPGQRYPYGDKVLIYAAPGEEYITNRNGEADRFRADRAAGRIPAYANGGTVGWDDRQFAPAAQVRQYENFANHELATAASRGSSAGKQINVDFKVMNPKPEPASVTARALSDITWLLGGQ